MPLRGAQAATLLALLTASGGCGGAPPEQRAGGPFLIVLGVAQDGGWPQAGCRKDCCRRAWSSRPADGRVACVALVDPGTRRRFLFDATPHLPDQVRALDEAFPVESSPGLDGIFLTHAHVGHYAGLVHVGHEVMGARGVTVYAMPRMRAFLSGHGPWDQLVRFGNVEVRPLEDGVPVVLGPDLRVTPFLVPHRDEYTETVGFRIDGPGRSAAFLPDIDKWERWQAPVETLIAGVDRAFLDGTFFDGAELPGRDLSQIPHPFIAESLERFAALPAVERAKVRFIHLNHTNPALREGSPERRRVVEAGLGVAAEGEVFPL